jgi:hypothetical protein
MSVTADALMTNAAELLFDTSYERWDRDFHLDSINEAERTAVILKPDINVVTDPFVLVAGAQQSWPSGCVQPIMITRNMGDDGETPGDSITLVLKKDLDEFKPDWHSIDNADLTVIHYAFDERNPGKFWVYPAQPLASQTYIEGVYCGTPTALTDRLENINLDDVYQDMIKDYMLYRAHSMDAAHSEFSASRSLYYWNLFVTSLERKDLVERAYSPKKINDNANK